MMRERMVAPGPIEQAPVGVVQAQAD